MAARSPIQSGQSSPMHSNRSPLSPKDSLFELPARKSDRLLSFASAVGKTKQQSFSTFRVTKKYLQRRKPTLEKRGPIRQIITSSTQVFMEIPKQSFPRPKPLPLKDLLVLQPKASKNYTSLSEIRKLRKSLSSDTLTWRPVFDLRPPKDESKNQDVEACRNMYLSFDPHAGKYGVAYKDDVKTRFKAKVRGYLVAHKEIKQSSEKKLAGKGKLRLHPDKSGKTGNGTYGQVSPLITPIHIL